MKKISLLIICLLLCSCTKTISVSKESIIGGVVPTSSKLTLSMVGDALIHSPIYKSAYKDGIYDFSDLFTEVKSEFENSDLLYYNAETIIGGKELGYSGYPRFNTPKEFAEEMISLGFNIISRANNHTLDKGEAGLLNACNFWNKYPTVLTNGSACTKDERDIIKVHEKNGIRYSLLSYTTSTNGLRAKKDYYVNIYSDEQVYSDVLKVKDDADVIIVAMHWGNEYKSLPNNEQKRIAAYLSSIGVNIVIGTHPHVIQPIEWIDDTLVIYSLGNFVSGQSYENEYARRIGLLANVDIIKIETETEKKIILENLNTELLYTYSNLKKYKIIPFSKIDNNILYNYNIYKDKYKKVVSYYMSDIIVE